jgi:uncharacterized protein YdhG (YjbR/CyaY superfamily)
MKKPNNIKEYIESFGPLHKKRLNEINSIVLKFVKQNSKKKTNLVFEELISYGMPAYKVNKKILLYFGGFKNHVSLFPGRVAAFALRKEFSQYVTSKGTIQFPLDKKIPSKLVLQILKSNLSKIIIK